MTGVYKITSPSGNVYIGQSRHIKRRWARYRDAWDIRKQHAICRSFNKYGIENHVFSVEHELPNDVSQEVLNNYEVLYINQYKGCGFTMLNLKEGGSNGKMPEESKNKIGLSKLGNTNRLGKLHSEETKIKISETKRGNCTAWNKGIPWSKDVKEKMYRFPKGNTPWNKGKTYNLHSEEEKTSISVRFKKYWQQIKASGIKISLSGKDLPQSKLDIQLVSDIINLLYQDVLSYKKIAKIYNVTPTVIRQIKTWQTWKDVLSNRRLELKNMKPKYKH